MSGYQSENVDDSGTGNKGMLRRIYRRQAKQRDRGRTRDRDAKYADNWDAGRDQQDDDDRRLAEVKRAARERRQAETALAEAGNSIKQLESLLAQLSTKSKDHFAHLDTPLIARTKTVKETYGKLSIVTATPADILKSLTPIKADILALTDQITQVLAAIQKPNVDTMLVWAGERTTRSRFPNIHPLIMTIHHALTGGPQIDLATANATIGTIQAAQAAEAAALQQRNTLDTKWQVTCPLVLAIFHRIDTGTGKPQSGPAVVLHAPISAIFIVELHPDLLDPMKCQALDATIQQLDTWAKAVQPAINGFKYFDAVLDGGKNPFTIAHGKGDPSDDLGQLKGKKTKTTALPPAQTWSTVTNSGVLCNMLVSACLAVPFNLAPFQTACNEAINFPGPWMGQVKQDNALQAAQQALQAAAAGKAALSQHLQGQGWNMTLQAADALAEQFYNQFPNALTVITNSGLTQATWNLLGPYIADKTFANMAEAFTAIRDHLKTDAAVQALCTQRLAYRDLTDVNGAAILASGAARLFGVRGYPSGGALGASINVVWQGWMPGQFASEKDYWGAVHFHFNGTTLASGISMVHIKVYETQVVGGHGALNTITGTAFAATCAGPVLASGVTI
jgi:hypothetical protein